MRKGIGTLLYFGRHNLQVPVPVFSTGSGTSSPFILIGTLTRDFRHLLFFLHQTASLDRVKVFSNMASNSQRYR
jgi:hypothetical protein